MHKDVIKIYNKYRDIVLQDARFALHSDQNYKWYILDHDLRSNNRKIDELVIPALDEFSDEDEISVIDFCCGVPWLWEVIENITKVKEFVGIDKLPEELIQDTMKDLKSDFTYFAGDVKGMLNKKFFYKKFDLVISGNVIVKLDDIRPFAKEKSIILYEYDFKEVLNG